LKNIQDLTKEDAVIFKNENGDCFDGNILFVNNNKATIIYLYGLKCEYTAVPLENILAYVDKDNGEYQHIDCYKGYFVKLQ
jgi:hypothetical protein